MYRVVAKPLREGYSVSQMSDGISAMLEGGAGRYREDVSASVYEVRCVLPVLQTDIATVAAELAKGLPVVIDLVTSSSTSSDHACWPHTETLKFTWVDQRRCNVSVTLTAVRLADYPFST
jgi:hypothetical protein